MQIQMSKIKFPEESTNNIFITLNQANVPLKGLSKKEKKIDNLVIKIKNFYYSKINTNGVKMQVTDQEKIFAIHIVNKKMLKNR